ncbi:hypothetical protein A2V82_16380 [candidate division KSB1 bacterium RBG_16_48_16]|nr:MAG: hypothetical protein A2V82_16380 [candidate division KSB1 bacterium RBG_16_48_16]
MWQEEMVEELKEADCSGRKAVLAKYSEKSGFSNQHLYRVAAEYGWVSGKKTRADKGELKTGLTDDQVQFIAALLYETGRENKGPIMPMERAIEIAEGNGIIEQGQATPGTMNRILKERQMSKTHMKAPEPHTNMRSLHPNHVHLVDVSVCIQYYLKNGRLAMMDERDFYKNKPENFAKIKMRLLRYLLDDHFSGAFYLHYYETSGETSDNLWDFLKKAWAHKGNDKYHFRGVPFQLLMDTGAANKSKAITKFLETLGVSIPKGRPYNPKRQGAVETSHTIIEEWFESGLRIQPATSVEQLNEWAADFMVGHHARRIHSRHKMTRSQAWSLITAEQLRELPSDEILQELYSKPEEERTVRNYTIEFKGKEYSLKHITGLFNGAKVMAVLKPFKLPAIDVIFNKQAYEAQPIEMLPAHMGGFRADAAVIGESFRAMPETETQRAIKRMDNMAFGEIKKKNAIPFEGLTVFGREADKVEGVAFIRKAGTAIEVDRGLVVENMPMAEFFRKLFQAIGPIAPELNQELRAKYGTSINKKEAEEVIEKVASGQWPVAGEEQETRLRMIG